MRKGRTVKQFGLGKRKKKNNHAITKFEVAKLELHDGDTLVLRTDQLLSKARCDELRDAARKQFPGIKVVILSAGLSLAVLQDKRTQARAA